MIKYHRHNRGPAPDFKPMRVEILDCDILEYNKEKHKYKIRIKCNQKIVWVKGKYVHGTYEELHPIDYNIDMPVPYKD
jgi:hypothetical protein